MGSKRNTSSTEDIYCRSAGELCESEVRLVRSDLHTFIDTNGLDLGSSSKLRYDATAERARFIEAQRSDEYSVRDRAGSGETLDETYHAASDDLEDAIYDALVDLIGETAPVDSVLEPLKNWKHGSYSIHTPDAVPAALKSGDGYAHYAQTHELVCKEALSISTDVRNGRLEGSHPSVEEIEVLQYIHGLSRQFLREHLDDPPFALYRGIGGVAFGEVGRQLIDGETPPVVVDENAALTNFTPLRDVAASFRGLILSISVPEEFVAVAADHLFKCRDADGAVTNCHAEIRVATDIYDEPDGIELLLPSGTEAVKFLREPSSTEPEDHRFMASLLYKWFGDGGTVVPETAVGYDRIERWYDQYEELLMQQQLEALEAGDQERADRLDERLRIVNDLKKTAESVRNERGY